MAIIDGLLQEFEMEAQTTRRVLERVPSDQLSWRPHVKSRSLGDLALHVAAVPAAVAQLAAGPSPTQAPDFSDPPSPQHASELLTALERSVATVKATLADMDDEAMLETWRLMRGDRELVAAPRVAFLRSIMLNHWYHHRGQLTGYLRELNVPGPSIYGPSADENPFA
ncbi:MAG TPA: DinB family protein [Gemmatimonadales bacterium]|nr:DinB family protein [Gemmatimonadales bacterium]